MSGFHDPVGSAPDAQAPRFRWLLAGTSAAPLFWLGQMVLAYGVTATVCYPADHPVHPAGGSLFLVLMLFDMVAVLGCAAGGWVSWRAWQQMKTGDGYGRFLALWGLVSGFCFGAAILFNIAASLMVLPCRG